MKTPLSIGIAAALSLLGLPLSAAFENWTSVDGRTTELELIKVTEADGGKVCTFRTRNGGTAVLPVSKLAEADRPRLDAWKDPAAPAPTPSAFDAVLDGNLFRLEGDAMVKVAKLEKPTKHYVFYYSAAWCGPCQRYTPSLVEFYNKTKPGNNTFEIIFISSDKSQEAMEGYVSSKKMPWPVLDFAKKAEFRQQFNHGVRGIPAVVVCDLEGKIVAQTRSLDELSILLGGG